MSKYLVLKRLTEDRPYLPGELLPADFPRADILRERGFVEIVPDDYVSGAAVDHSDDIAAYRQAALRPNRRPTAIDDDDGAPDGGGTLARETSGQPTGEPGPISLDDLLTLSRKDLNELAVEQGIEKPDEMQNKRLVAEAIVAAMAAAADDAAAAEGEDNPEDPEA